MQRGLGGVLDGQGETFECGSCGVIMTPASSKESRIRYHHCPSCGLWCASPYDADLMRYGTLRTAGAPRRPDSAFSAIKARLERWLRAKDAAPDETAAEAPVRVQAASRR